MDCSKSIFCLIHVYVIILYMRHVTDNKTQAGDKQDILVKYTIRISFAIYVTTSIYCYRELYFWGLHNICYRLQFSL